MHYQGVLQLQYTLYAYLLREVRRKRELRRELRWLVATPSRLRGAHLARRDRDGDALPRRAAAGYHPSGELLFRAAWRAAPPACRQRLARRSTLRAKGGGEAMVSMWP